MRSTRGFTLLEILIVVVIAASVLVFAVPAYQRAQDRNAYLSATGVLLDLGNAVQALRADGGNLPNAESGVTQVLQSWQTLAEDSDTYWNVLSPSLGDLSQTQLGQALFVRNYLQPIAYEAADSNTYKGYSFYICPTTASSTNCCGNNANVVACMEDADAAATRAAADLYYGARVLRDGTIEQISQAPSTN